MSETRSHRGAIWPPAPTVQPCVPLPAQRLRHAGRGPCGLPEVALRSLLVSRLTPVVGAERVAAAERELEALRSRLDGRQVWHISDSAARGGVAETLREELPYFRGAGIAMRWATLDAPPAFRRFTKALYYRLCGVRTDGSQPEPDGDRDRDRDRPLYERVCREAAERFVAGVGRGGIAVVHDHQAAGLIPQLREAGFTVLWRAHIGAPSPPQQADPAWEFLYRYVADAHGCIASYPGALPLPLPLSMSQPQPPPLPRGLPQPGRPHIVRPSINPLAAKNIPLRAPADRVLEAVGPLPPRTPLVTQVGRWDAVKDVPGVIRAFADHVDPAFGAHLLLVGPSTEGDPHAGEVFAQCRRARSGLGRLRARVRVLRLPVADSREHALTVNAIQRCSALVIQKSLAEGFGLTVSEAAWKGRAVIASPVGGLRQQVEHGRSGLLLTGPHDLAGLGAAVNRLLADPAHAAELGRNGHEHVRRHFLIDIGLRDFARVLTRTLPC
ncbi:glycosyltransferase [Streptomyces sp. NPDC050617]|uniref:glycosyltransferase n=1 Tax=Streptomyces sp. NPDC050617 TaxID=3154628 RepID=UPI00342B32F6